MRPWASPTDVTSTNPRAPTEVESSYVDSYGRAAFFECAESDRSSDDARNPALPDGKPWVSHLSACQMICPKTKRQSQSQRHDQ